MAGLRYIEREFRNEPLASAFIGNAIENRIEWKQWIARKVHLRDQPA